MIDTYLFNSKIEKLKLLLTSPDALIDNNTGNFFPGLEPVLHHFLEMDENNGIVTVSLHPDKLKRIPKEFTPLPIKWSLRGSPRFIEWIKKEVGYDYSDIIILGAKINDLAQAANSKLLLLSAKYAQSNNPEDRFYIKDYGLPINKPKDLQDFFERFALVSNPWFYKLELPPKTTVYALTNANTNPYVNTDISDLNYKLKALLKAGKTENVVPFITYFLVSTYKIYQEVKDIDFWGVYPTSTGEPNEGLDYFLKKVRESFAKSQPQPLLIRHTSSPKRQGVSRIARIKVGCDDQFDSIIINPFYRGKLEGKSICVMDDFTTYGTSCETIRHLFGIEGVARIIFIAIGKYGKEYVKYRYKLEGDLYNSYSYNKVVSEFKTGEFNKDAEREFKESIKGLV